MKNSIVTWHGYNNYNMNCNIEDLKKRGFECSSYNNDLVSNSLKGAKRYATNRGYDKVGIRYNSGYHCSVVAIKINNKWTKPKKGE
jgi:hypothetical protein